MTGVAPDPASVHEPTEACAAVHCWSHDVDEPDPVAWRICFECHHVYPGPEDLQREWTENAPPDLRDGPAPPVEDIYFCPLFLHDW